MGVMKKPLLFLVLSFLLAIGCPAQASSWLQCRWQVALERVGERDVVWRYLEFLGSDGSGSLDAAGCRRMAPDGPIEKTSIESPPNLLAPGIQAVATWFTYSAMTPDGAMSASGWRLSPMEDD